MESFDLHETSNGYFEADKNNIYVYLDDENGYRLEEVSRENLTVIQTDGTPRIEYKCTNNDVSNWVLFPFKQDMTFDCTDSWGDREKTVYIPAGSMDEDTLKEFAS